MAAGDPVGGLIMVSTGTPIEIKSTASVTVGGSSKRVTGRGNLNYIYAWRMNKYNDPILHLTPYPVEIDGGDSKVTTSVKKKASTMGGAYLKSEDALSDWGGDNYNLYMFNYYSWISEFNSTSIFKMIINDNRKLWNFGSYAGYTYYFSPEGGDKGFTTNGDLSKTNKDAPWDASNDNCVNNMNLKVGSHLVFQINDSGAFNNTPWKVNTMNDKTITIQYPPYRTLPKGVSNVGEYGEGNGNDTTGGKDIEGDHGTLTASKQYSISRAGDTTNKLTWNKGSSSGDYGLSIKTEVTVNGTTTDQSGKTEYSFTTPNSIAYTYYGKVKRYYKDYSDIMVYSNRVTFLTYSKPTLSSISLSKTVISPRDGASLRVSLNGINNRTFTAENNFRTKIWSNKKGSKSSPYLDYESTSSSKDLTAAQVKALFPDTSASNGEVAGIVDVTRRNLGVSGGNPR